MDEARPLFISHALAAALGAAWLALVYLSPSPPPTIALLRPEEAAAVDVQFEDERPKPEPPKPKPADEPPAAAKAATPKELARQRKEEKEIGDAFGSGKAMVGDVTNALRGVSVAQGGKDAAVTGTGKAVIAYGQGGAGARTPGRGLDPSVAAAGAGIGKVNAAGAVARGSIAVTVPQVVRSADGGPSGRDVAKLGTFVRTRQAQLQYCYLEQGLAINPNLAGSVGVTVQIDAAGAVGDVRVTNRTWNGAGTTETEQCIVQRVKGWSFPPSGRGAMESYSFTFVFSR